MMASKIFKKGSMTSFFQLSSREIRNGANLKQDPRKSGPSCEN